MQVVYTRRLNEAGPPDPVRARALPDDTQIWQWLRPDIRCVDRDRQGDPKAPPASCPSPRWRKARDLRTRLSHGSVSNAVHGYCAWHSLADDAAGLFSLSRLSLLRRHQALAETSGRRVVERARVGRQGDGETLSGRKTEEEARNLLRPAVGPARSTKRDVPQNGDRAGWEGVVPSRAEAVGRLSRVSGDARAAGYRDHRQRRRADGRPGDEGRSGGLSRSRSATRCSPASDAHSIWCATPPSCPRGGRPLRTGGQSDGASVADPGPRPRRPSQQEYRRGPGHQPAHSRQPPRSDHEEDRLKSLPALIRTALAAVWPNQSLWRHLELRLSVGARKCRFVPGGAALRASHPQQVVIATTARNRSACRKPNRALGNRTVSSDPGHATGAACDPLRAGGAWPSLREVSERRVHHPGASACAARALCCKQSAGLAIIRAGLKKRW